MQFPIQGAARMAPKMLMGPLARIKLIYIHCAPSPFIRVAKTRLRIA